MHSIYNITLYATLLNFNGVYLANTGIYVETKKFYVMVLNAYCSFLRILFDQHGTFLRELKNIVIYI